MSADDDEAREVKLMIMKIIILGGKRSADDDLLIERSDFDVKRSADNNDNNIGG